MKSINKIFYLIATMCVAVLIFSGCTANRTTTKFMATPMESVNEDLSIDPAKLTRELDDEMRAKMKREEICCWIKQRQKQKQKRVINLRRKKRKK